MAVRIRMQRVGKKNQPYYRIAAVDSRFKRDGRFLEILGHYDPRAKEETQGLRIDLERVAHWTAHGALVSERVEPLLARFRRIAPALAAAQAAKTASKPAPASASASSAPKAETPRAEAPRDEAPKPKPAAAAAKKPAPTAKKPEAKKK